MICLVYEVWNGFPTNASYWETKKVLITSQNLISPTHCCLQTHFTSPVGLSWYPKKVSICIRKKEENTYEIIIKLSETANICHPGNLIHFVSHGQTHSACFKAWKECFWFVTSYSYSSVPKITSFIHIQMVISECSVGAWIQRGKVIIKVRFTLQAESPSIFQEKSGRERRLLAACTFLQIEHTLNSNVTDDRRIKESAGREQSLPPLPDFSRKIEGDSARRVGSLVCTR